MRLNALKKRLDMQQSKHCTYPKKEAKNHLNSFPNRRFANYKQSWIGRNSIASLGRLNLMLSLSRQTVREQELEGISHDCGNFRSNSTHTQSYQLILNFHPIDHSMMPLWTREREKFEFLFLFLQSKLHLNGFCRFKCKNSPSSFFCFSFKLQLQ